MALIGVVVCGAGPASDIGKLIQLLHEKGYDVRLVATPSAAPFLDVDALEAMTGRSIRSEHRSPGEPRSDEKTDAYVVAPATFNTINKLAAGISDTYALDVLNEAIGLKVPIIAVPFVNSALASRPPFKKSIRYLQSEGVVCVGDGSSPQHHPPGSGDQARQAFPWQAAVELLGENGTLILQ